MLVFKSLVIFALLTPLALSASSSLSKRAVTQAVLDDLVLYTKYASALELTTGSCPKPLNSTLVVQFANNFTQTQGLITRDDARKEIILGFAGSEQLLDAVTDLDLLLVPYISQGVSSDLTSDALVEQGDLIAYNSVTSGILATIASQLAKYPSYSLVSIGHSLGGALASIAGVSLKANFPHVPLRMFTFGQPRTGNSGYAALVEKLIGKDNLFRVIHTTDGVPTLVPRILGYQHHGIEYWNFQDPGKLFYSMLKVGVVNFLSPLLGTAENVKVCTEDEDPTCSDSIPTGGINAPHLLYFGQNMGQDPSLCGL